MSKRRFSGRTLPIKYEDEVINVRISTANELGLVKWQVISDAVFMEIFDKERVKEFDEIWRRGSGDIGVEVNS